MIINKERVERAFEDYVKTFDQNDPRIRLKVEHTTRVANLCERIAREQKQEEELVQLAWLIGMLHDIGRFEQLKQYATFNDTQSINHAHFGVDLLFGQGLIKQFMESKKYEAIIRTAIWYHNAYVLPSDLDERTLFFCNVIRDADKIDILKVNVDIPLETVYEFRKEQFNQATITKEVMEDFYQHQAVKHSKKKTPLDHVVGHISLVFELVFPISLRIVEEQGYLKKLLEFQTPNEIAKKQLVEIKREMLVFLESIN